VMITRRPQIRLMTNAVVEEGGAKFSPFHTGSNRGSDGSSSSSDNPRAWKKQGNQNIAWLL
jgi:hypothetical protein